MRRDSHHGPHTPDQARELAMLDAALRSAAKAEAAESLPAWLRTTHETRDGLFELREDVSKNGLRAGIAADIGYKNDYEPMEDRALAAPDLGLFAIADGIGGHRDIHDQSHGDIAATIALGTVREIVEQELRPQHGMYDAARTQEILRRAVVVAHHRITEACRRYFEDKDMHFPDTKRPGTCMTVAHLGPQGGDGSRHLLLLQVGDTRGYKYHTHTGKLEQLTTDHAHLLLPTDVPEYVNQGDPRRRIVARALGAKDWLSGTFSLPTITEHTLTPGELLLLTTDGIHDLLTATEKDPSIEEQLTRVLDNATEAHMTAAQLETTLQDILQEQPVDLPPRQRAQHLLVRLQDIRGQRLHMQAQWGLYEKRRLALKLDNRACVIADSKG